ncbi:hypothetical protein PIB30_001128 [Stylosanthes scabra]|uniref:Uncharacterized protein n=1 Tax=Stylosanthes scabra TaxID=79078 RepID=A0ABU6U1L9_9FABA|nr:hypothetical protein [Stylosanthes scabra]
MVPQTYQTWQGLLASKFAQTFEIVQVDNPGPSANFLRWWFLDGKRFLAAEDAFHQLPPNEIPVKATQRQPASPPQRQRLLLVALGACLWVVDAGEVGEGEEGVEAGHHHNRLKVEPALVTHLMCIRVRIARFFLYLRFSRMLAHPCSAIRRKHSWQDLVARVPDNGGRDTS